VHPVTLHDSSLHVTSELPRNSVRVMPGAPHRLTPNALAPQRPTQPVISTLDRAFER
jgi:hypothetical protein